MLIYSRVNGAFSPIYALSRTHLRGFKTASEDHVILFLVDNRWISVVKAIVPGRCGVHMMHRRIV
jgi:hypothetical protein